MKEYRCTNCDKFTIVGEGICDKCKAFLMDVEQRRIKEKAFLRDAVQRRIKEKWHLPLLILKVGVPVAIISAILTGSFCKTLLITAIALLSVFFLLPLLLLGYLVIFWSMPGL